MTVASKSGSRRRSLIIVSLIMIVVVGVFSFLLVSMFLGARVSPEDFSPEGFSTETALRDAVDNAINPEILVINADICLTRTLVIPDGKNITLTSSNKTEFFKLIGANSMSVISVEAGGTLRLDGVIVTHDDRGTGTGIYVNSNGTLIMIDGEIVGNTGWHPIPDSGGGSIGGGVSVLPGGVFVMYGGVISKNTATMGGGVNVYPDGIFELIGGVISDNTADYGGGVNVSSGSFSMSGGTIIHNVATYYGGGVGLWHGSFSMLDGTITGNTASRAGGGVYDDYNGTFNRSGGKISGNSANVGSDVYQLIK